MWNAHIGDKRKKDELIQEPIFVPFEQNCFFHNAATIFSHLKSAAASKEQQTSPCVFCNTSFHLVISVQSIKSTYSVLKYSSLSDSVYVCVCVCVCAYVQEKRTWTHGARGRLLAKDSHIASFYNKSRKKNSYISYLPVKFSTVKSLSDEKNKKKQKKKRKRKQWTTPVRFVLEKKARRL